MKIRNFIFVFSAIVTLVGCDSSTVFEENLRIKNAAWERNETAFFEFEIKDSTAIYDL